MGKPTQSSIFQLIPSEPGRDQRRGLFFSSFALFCQGKAGPMPGDQVKLACGTLGRMRLLWVGFR